MRHPQLIVVAGPNGVGKSTYARSPFAADILLVDPDRQESQTGRTTPMTSGRRAVRRVREALSRGEDLAMETTLAGKSPIHVIDRAKRAGYDVTLLYIGIEDPDVCVRRVARRVERGGHGVPEVEIRRRFVRSVEALPEAIGRVDQVILYDNPASAAYRLIARSAFRTTAIADDIPSWARSAVAAIRNLSRA